jgi:hypothetical protein
MPQVHRGVLLVLLAVLVEVEVALAAIHKEQDKTAQQTQVVEVVEAAMAHM